MLTLTEIVFTALGSGLLLFMIIPCCAYWFKICDVTQFSRHDVSLQSRVDDNRIQAVI